LLQLERIVADQVPLQALDGQLRAFASAPHLSQPGQPFVGLDLDDGADEPPPVGAVGMAQRRLQRHGNGRCFNIRNLHADSSSYPYSGSTTPSLASSPPSILYSPPVMKPARSLLR